MKNVLLYIISCGLDKLNYLEIFIKELSYKKINITILFEFEDDYNLFMINNQNRSSSIYHINQLKFDTKNKENEIINNQYYKFFKNTDKYNIEYFKIYSKFNFLFKEKKIEFCIFNFGQGILNSFSACVLNDYCKRFNIENFFPMTNSPLNGRFLIYDDIYQKHK